ncbi:hypothetical protein FIBSPDRAFT_954545 [Athelia psychrophila]|uniref:hAT-like transposase RNase-H fold domain-containing protein n=1 Tax=Athelia psychrophila TaxID=1759441 RepID=A0A166J1A7_9AGAM|nr:hypothetical protein FIBSPDRAFT_954545 [Fibularhizoctonia sp. CBS 109695]
MNVLVGFIAADDQSINVIENPQLWALFLMLREELRDEDIPHRTKVCKCILEVWDEHLEQLADQMKGSLSKISFTTDMWSDTNLTPFMAITAHWIEGAPLQTSSGPQHKLGRTSSASIRSQATSTVSILLMHFCMYWIVLESPQRSVG